MRSLLCLLALCCLSSPAHAVKPKGKAAAGRAAEDNLTRVLAEQRREQIRSVGYKLELAFTSGKEEYRGKVHIALELADTNKPLSLDWQGRAPMSVSVNDESVPVGSGGVLLQTGSLTIPARYLKSSTAIDIAFVNDFGKEGEGIQHVVDPEDKEEYVYSDFEPYQAHQLFPCFDQPDLKAHFELTVTAPLAWKAIGNELVESETPTATERTTKFHVTPLLSTYLFFVGAGPFQEWKDQEGKIALVLYARKSLAKYMDAENLFNTMKKGLRFYRDYFGFDYPFAKFGLVFAPEFGWGGMENPGAVVVNEQNLFRGPVPSTRRDHRDDLILHEMAHHWFGDLVTMKWWSDLWLNESFATYMASLAQDRAFGSKIVWQDFASSKTWGYWQDQLVTTHPIETKVPDTRTARGNFDGITYAKGGAALEQLHFYVGEDAFRNGVQAYFRAHALGNAERADFTGAIASAGKLDLKAWTHAWLQTAGLNRVSVSVDCEALPEMVRETTEPNALAFTVHQEKSSSGTLSPHRSRVGFFTRSAESLRLADTEDVTFSGIGTRVIFKAGVPCPDFTFPNLDDKDYALYSLDAKSLENVQAVLGGAIADSLLRTQTWTVLSQMVRDGKLAPLRYLELAEDGLSKESDEGLLAMLLGRHSPVLEIYDEFLSPRDRRERAPGFERVLSDRLAASEKGSTRQMLFFDFFSRAVQTPENMARLAEWLEKNNPPEGITLDQERRWAALLSLARHGYPRAAELVSAEEKKDPTDLGKRMAYTARVALPDAAGKRDFWEALAHPEKIPPSTLHQAAGEFHQPNFQELSRSYVKSFFERLRKIDWKKSDHLVHVYFESLFPGTLCEKGLLRQSQAALRADKGLTELARRSWLEANDELERCVKVGRR